MKQSRVVDLPIPSLIDPVLHLVPPGGCGGPILPPHLLSVVSHTTTCPPFGPPARTKEGEEPAPNASPRRQHNLRLHRFLRSCPLSCATRAWLGWADDHMQTEKHTNTKAF